jgi:hypothetical protein
MYTFRVEIGGGVGTRLEDVDVSIDGQRAALLHYERGIERSLASADAPQGADYVRTEPILVKAGQQRVSVAFVRRTEGPYEDLIRPHDWSRAASGSNSAGTTTPPHVMELTVVGPLKTTGVSESPSRRIVFSCRPANPSAAEMCAEQIITRLATRAYRRPLTQHDRDGLMGFYRRASADGAADAFELGIRSALQVILASPHFVFRFERVPPNVSAGSTYNISDVELASRLSFFLWGTIPDRELIDLARKAGLSKPDVFERQVRRMIADPRSEALARRFAAQWLRLQDLHKIEPDALAFPYYDETLAEAMSRETELLFDHLVREDRPLLELLTADYTFVNERLARHYGLAGVSGPAFRKVSYPDERRRGVLGHGSILTLTSHGNRTSPVLRGKWVLEVLLGSPPPPPPPNVPDLEKTGDATDGRFLSVAEQLALHRESPACSSCHNVIDPIGLALDNFDVDGSWRIKDRGVAVNPAGELYDGTKLNGVADLRAALVARSDVVITHFTEMLMAYALGRRVEYYDMPAIRRIVRDAERQNYRLSSLILGVTQSGAFRTALADTTGRSGGR